MTKSRKDGLLRLINLELGKAEISTEKTSAAVELAKEFIANLRKLLEEVESANDEKPDSAIPVSYLEISYDSGETAKFYLVNKNALLPGILLITPNSPIGKAVMDKKVGDDFSYEIKLPEESKVFKGKIEKID